MGSRMASYGALMFVLLVMCWANGAMAAEAPEASSKHIQIAAREDVATAAPNAATALTAIKLAVKGKHSQAQVLKGEIKDPAALKLIEWLYIRGSKPVADFETIARFIADNPKWPQMDRIAARAELALYLKPDDPAVVLQHFKIYPARSGFGKIAHARALIATGKPERARELVRSAWRESNFSAATETKVRAEFKSQITGDDHRARLVRLIYERQTKAAERTAAMISSGHVKMAKAANALFKRHKRALRLYQAVPSSLRNQLVMQYALARYHRRKGQSDKARAIVLKVPANSSEVTYPEPWWDERWALIRTALDRGKPELWPQAYQMAKAHGVEDGTSFVQGEFMSGWIALRFLKKPKLAAEHFKRILERDEKPLNVSQARYWLGRCHLALEDKEEAVRQFELAAKFPTTFYGQMALDQLGRGGAPIPISKGPDISPEAQTAFTQNEMVQAIKLLAKAGQNRMLPVFFSTLAYRLETAEERVALAKLAVELGELWLSVRVAKVSATRGIALEDLAYPKDALPAAKTSRNPIERALIYAISRQESEFNPRAISHAGAMGLMQMMPGTAKQVTKKHGLRYRKASLINQPSYNVTLGTAFLGDLLERFNGSYISTIAGYNAGPGRIAQWNKRYGDPHKGEVEAVDWIESIPFNETRNYVKRVLENVQVYRTLFADVPLMSLSADLARGNEKPSDTQAKNDCSPPSESTIEKLIACN